LQGGRLEIKSPTFFKREKLEIKPPLEREKLEIKSPPLCKGRAREGFLEIFK